MQQPYFFHKLLPGQIKKYMKENERVNVEVMINHLIQNYYQQYDENNGNKAKVSEFRKSVNKAYEWVLSQRKSNPSGKSSKKEKKADNFYIIDREGSPDIVIEKETKKKLESDSSFLDNMYKASSPACNGSSQKPTPKKTEKTFKNLKRKRDFTEFGDFQLSPPKKKKLNGVKLTPTCKFQTDYVGFRSIIKEMRVIHSYIRGYKDPIPNTVILGPKGSGKSLIVECLAGELGIPIYRISAKSLLGGVGVDPDDLVTEVVTEARAIGRCIIHIDELDDLSTKEQGTTSKKADVKISGCLKKIINEQTYSPNERFVVIVESRSKPDADILSLLEYEVMLPLHSNESKKLLLEKYIGQNTERSLTSDVNLEEIAEKCTSFVAGDLKTLVIKAIFMAISREIEEDAADSDDLFPCDGPAQARHELKQEDFLAALPKVSPTLKQEGFQIPATVKWEEVQGLEEAKKIIKLKIIGRMKQRELYDMCGIEKSSILMYGPPGCGKTLLAQAIANEAGINLLSVKGPELLQMYQGESERAVRQVFEKAASVAPCIIFFDEFESLGPSRIGNADNGSRSSIVNMLLAELDGFGVENDVYVIAATNRPEIIDAAILRPGRIDTSLYVGVPDQKGRKDILEFRAKKIKMAPDVDLDEIASSCENFTGADCAELFKSASLEALQEVNAGFQKKENFMLSRRHFDKALENAIPSVSQEKLEEFLNKKKSFEETKKTKKGKEKIPMQEIS